MTLCKGVPKAHDTPFEKNVTPVRHPPFARLSSFTQRAASWPILNQKPQSPKTSPSALWCCHTPTLATVCAKNSTTWKPATTMAETGESGGQLFVWCQRDASTAKAPQQPLCSADIQPLFVLSPPCRPAAARQHASSTQLCRPQGAAQTAT